MKTNPAITKSQNEEKSSCESCGEVFSCGANLGKCWCFSLAIPNENLAQLKEQFKRCLCSNCLEKYSQKPQSNEKI